jgi:hypothetical protein
MQWPKPKSKERQSNGQTINQRRENAMANFDLWFGHCIVSPLIYDLAIALPLL